MKCICLSILGATLLLVSTVSRAQQVFNSDVIVIGSECVGIDCTNAEAFGFDTIRLKENNLRIKFEDTSNSASFPSTDWQITVNDSANGGLNKFSIDDVSAGRTPFTIEGGAPNNSLYVDDGGRIGLGTSTPVVQVHVVDGNTPTLRLDQDGSSGFTAQTWDVAGNETNFFVRDATNGSLLPLKIKPGAPTDSVVVGANGNIGNKAGTNPLAPLHIFRNDSTQEFILLDSEQAGGAQDRPMLRLENNGGIRFQFDNVVQGTAWRFQAATGNQDNFEITKVGTGKIEFKVDASGNAYLAGVLNESSDRNAKTNITPVDPDTVLDKVAQLPIAQWAYKESPDVHHIGPMAQDFRAAFGTGSNETTLATMDVGGVAIASIQALEARGREYESRSWQLEAENQSLQSELSLLKQEVQELKALLLQLNTQVVQN